MRYAAAEAFTSVEAVVENECSCIDNDTDEDLIEAWIDRASDELTRLSMGRVYGRRTVTVRPCREVACSPCACGCRLDSVRLWGPDPVVSSVTIDGDTLDHNLYAVHQRYDGYFLVRTPTGNSPLSWPSNQKLWLAATEDDTFAITFTYGVHIDATIEAAAIEMVCYYAGLVTAKRNTLPKGTVSANYNNTSLSLRESTLNPDGSGADGQAVGAATGAFAAFWGGPRNEFWSPELDEWSLIVGS